MDPARLKKIPVFADVDDQELRLFTLTGWDIRRLRKSAPDAVDHLRSVVAERRDHA
ncbi:MAG: hypothetical protein M3P44_09725 [Actinomycetota bacterium]|nr:hypothetical protein [Actinomycetota bacterium]